MTGKKFRRAVVILLCLVTLMSIVSVTASAAYAQKNKVIHVETSSSSKRSWWDKVWNVKPKIKITNTSGENINIWVEDDNGRYVANCVPLRKGKSMTVKLDYDRGYSVYGHTIWQYDLQNIRVESANKYINSIK